ncbi:MAG: hypothetical protein IPK80_06170 [Nannocystis sp.]|nr:hypothetical protein [Nannocystis sp.]
MRRPARARRGALAAGLWLWLGGAASAAPAGASAGDEGAEEAGAEDMAAAPGSSSPSSDASAPVAVTTRLTPDPSSIGDLLTLEVSAAYPSGYRVNLPMGLEFAPLHLVGVEEEEPVATGQGSLRKVFRVQLQRFATGEARTPAFPLTYVGPKGEVETVRVPAHAFTVRSLLANEADPQRQGEDPPVSIEYPAERAELVIYASAVAMAAGFVAALLWRRWRRRLRPVIGPPPVPAHEQALGALAELEGRGLLETGLFEDYYVQLTEITKGYLEGRFGVEALDRTTEELRRELIRSGDRIAPLRPSEVIAFLQGCDLVKFARYAPELAAAREDLARVRAIVEETRADLARPAADAGAPGSSTKPPEGAGPPGAASDMADETGEMKARAEAGE